MLHDVLPEGLIWLSDTSNKKYDSETGILSIGNLNVNETYSFDIVTIVNATGKIINKVNVTSAEFDSNLTNNYAEKSLFVNPAADLSVIKSVSNANPKYKDSINWTIEISNNGPDVAHDVTMFDLLPKSLIYVNSDEDYDVESGLWVVGTLGKGEKAVLKWIKKQMKASQITMIFDLELCCRAWFPVFRQHIMDRVIPIERDTVQSLIPMLNQN